MSCTIVNFFEDPTQVARLRGTPFAPRLQGEARPHSCKSTATRRKQSDSPIASDMNPLDRLFPQASISPPAFTHQPYQPELPFDRHLPMPFRTFTILTSSTNPPRSSVPLKYAGVYTSCESAWWWGEVLSSGTRRQRRRAPRPWLYTNLGLR